jgi:hypothetical protein
MFDFIDADANLILLIVYAVAGIVQCLMGYRFFKLIIALNGFFAGAAAGDYLAKQVVPDQTLIHIITALLLGLVVAIFAFTVYLMGVVLIGAFGGALAGMYVGEAFGFETIWLPVGLSVVCGILALLIQKTIIIAATSIIGAAAIVYTPYYYLEFWDGKTWNNFGQIRPGDGIFVMLGVIILAIVGIVVQTRLTATKMVKTE